MNLSFPRRMLVVFVFFATLFTLSNTAFAAWVSSGNGTLAGSATTLPAGVALTLGSGAQSQPPGTIPLSWTPPSFAGAATGTIIDRINTVPGATTQTACGGPLAGGTTSCTDSPGPGNWTYNQTPNYYNWVGAQGPSLGAQVWNGYDLAAFNLHPSFYWRFAETSGTIAGDSTGQNNYGNYQGGVALRTGSYTGFPTPTFNGSTGLVSAGYGPITAPQNFTVGGWFKTTAAGGTIASFTNSTSTNPSLWDRQIWLNGNGQVVFGVFTNIASGTNGLDQVNEITSSIGNLNNGQWNLVQASIGPAGMELWVNGDLYAANAAYTSAQTQSVSTSPTAFTGYWHAGYGNFGTQWPNAPANGYFSGQLADISAFPTQLTPSQQQGLWTGTGQGLTDGTNITSISQITEAGNQTITINGNNFGTQAAYSGTSPYLVVNDISAGWMAGNSTDGNVVGFNVTSWTNNQIVLAGFVNGYGRPGSNWYITPGDQVQVVVTNPQSGVNSPTLQVTGAPTQLEQQTVITGGYALAWPMRELSGTSAVSLPGGYNGIYESGSTTAFNATNDQGLGGQPSPNFNGSSDYILGNAAAANGPTTYSTSLWFNTTSTVSGMLSQFGNSTTGNGSTAYDRMIYLNSTGNIVCGIYNGTVETLASPSAYNNGTWNNATCTVGSGGMDLYIDGSLVASNASYTTPQGAYTGYWHVGAGNLTSWPGQTSGSTGYFSGMIADVAIYNSVLSASQVSTFWKDAP